MEAALQLQCAQAMGTRELSSCSTGSAVAAGQAQSAGSGVVAVGLSCSVECRIFLHSGIELMFLALVGRFFSVISPGKSQLGFFYGGIICGHD